MNARLVAKEIECDDANELAFHEAELEMAEMDNRRWAGGGYTTHEIVGIGGKVKKKIRQGVLVGAIVKEYEDERLGGGYLKREQDGLNRSWCSWCSRVVPTNKDVDKS